MNVSNVHAYNPLKFSTISNENVPGQVIFSFYQGLGLSLSSFFQTKEKRARPLPNEHNIGRAPHVVATWREKSILIGHDFEGRFRISCQYCCLAASHLYLYMLPKEHHIQNSSIFLWPYKRGGWTGALRTGPHARHSNYLLTIVTLGLYYLISRGPIGLWQKDMVWFFYGNLF